jgi:hypothetical protein
MNTNITHIRGKARQGICLPIECSQEEITAASDAGVNFINFGIDILPTLGINIDILIFKTGFTQVYDKFVISDVRDQELRDQTYTGMLITLSLIIIIAVAVILANFYESIRAVLGGVLAQPKAQTHTDIVLQEISNMPELRRKTKKQFLSHY